MANQDFDNINLPGICFLGSFFSYLPIKKKIKGPVWEVFLETILENRFFFSEQFLIIIFCVFRNKNMFGN